MKYENEKLGCSFEFPDRPTVRQQLGFWERASGRGGLHSATWEGAKTLISAWECAVMPDTGIDLDTDDDPEHARVIMWVVAQVIDHMTKLETLPKN